jgi:hypothetical protein
MSDRGAQRVLLTLTLLTSGASAVSACTGGQASGTPDASSRPTSISGVVEKGPFILGSSVTVQTLDAHLVPTGQTFGVVTSDNLGSFVAPATIAAPYVEVIASGYYFDELTGQLSSSPVTLRAIGDATQGGTVDVNLLTSMSEPLVRSLVLQGADVATATSEAESEVLLSCGFDQSLGFSFSSVDLTSGGTSSAELLAASLLVEQYASSLGTSEVADLSLLLSEIGAASTDAGANAALQGLNGALCVAARAIDVTAVRANLTGYYASLGASVTVPAFEPFIASAASSCADGGGGTVSVEGGEMDATVLTDEAGLAEGGEDEAPSEPLDATADTAAGPYSDGGPGSCVGSATCSPWSCTEHMAIARSNQTMQLLRDGRVVVAGGENATEVLSSAELYDPQSGLWSPGPPMTNARSLAASVLLPDGGFLVAGGFSDEMGTVTSASDVFDPVTNAWTSGDMLFARTLFTLSLLSGGQVLASGGEGAQSTQSAATRTYMASTEVFDPTLPLWMMAGDMHAPRAAHAAAVLSDGKVLVSGGFDGSSVVATAELYDPATRTWTVTGSMLAARSGHVAATLSNGTVLVAGGVAGSTVLSSAELYDPATGTFASTGSMATGRNGFTVTLLSSGSVLAAGGNDLNLPLADVEVYDPSTGAWTSEPGMNEARTNHTAALLPSGKVLVVGGEKPSGATSAYTDTAELYDPAIVCALPDAAAPDASTTISDAATTSDASASDAAL